MEKHGKGVKGAAVSEKGAKVYSRVLLSVRLGIETEHYNEKFGSFEENTLDFSEFSNMAFKALLSDLKTYLTEDSKKLLKGVELAQKIELPSIKKKRDGTKVKEYMPDFIFYETPDFLEVLEELHEKHEKKRRNSNGGTSRKASSLDLSDIDLDDLTDDLFNEFSSRTREKIRGQKEKGAKVAERAQLKREKAEKAAKAKEKPKAAEEKPKAAEKVTPKAKQIIKAAEDDNLLEELAEKPKTTVRPPAGRVKSPRR